ncbi:MAG: nucleoside triphosphate pyrophosphohydrolase [Acidimicrobiia bacterium]
MSIIIVGLGPASLDQIDVRTSGILHDPNVDVIVRTADHPAAQELSKHRPVASCDDLYDSHDSFDAVYAAVTQRVLEAGRTGDVAYAVPGSPLVGERAVSALRRDAEEAGIPVTIVPARSFLDLAFGAVGIDPIADGLQVLDARDLPDPLPLHVPTIVTQVDSALRAADLSVSLARVLDDETGVSVLDRLGDPDQIVRGMTVAELARYEGGPRTSVFIPRHDVGLLGLVATNRVLREQCPWDMQQTHHSLLSHLVEEAYETADALGQLPAAAPEGEVDFGAYAEVEDELGDLLLQVVFHSTLAAEAGAFDIDEVAELNRRKLVRRHPHVFGGVEVDGASDVLANWEQIKSEEKQRESLMDDIPRAMPGVARAVKVQKRAASVGFDWQEAAPVFDVLRDEIDELRDAAGDTDETLSELGDVLFAAINLARHLRVDPEIALRGSVERFMARFRIVEAEFASSGQPMTDASQDELEQAWSRAKSELATDFEQST